jgi:hypothetical protein
MHDWGLWALRLGGTLHLVQLPSMAVLAIALRRHRLLDSLPPLLKRVLFVLAGGVVLAVLAGSSLCWLLPGPALSQPFGITFAISWSLFWAYRLWVQCFVYAPHVPLEQRWAHLGLVLLFCAKTLCFAEAARSGVAGAFDLAQAQVKNRQANSFDGQGVPPNRYASVQLVK